MSTPSSSASAVVATAYGGPEVLALVQRPVRPPQRGEVTIRVHAAGVNPLDCLRYSGAFGQDPDALPMPLGEELAGVVTAVGPDAVGPAGPARVGDEVIAYPREVSGAYATHVTWPAHGVLPKPAGLDWPQASGLLLAGSTAVHALTATRVGAGDTVLIHGVSGGVGLLAAQLAGSRGARVLGTAAAHRHDSLRGYGVQPVTYGPGLIDRATELAPDGVDAAIDAAGTDEALDTSLALVADRTRIATLVSFQRGNDAGINTLGSAGGATDPGTKIRATAWQELLPPATDGQLHVVLAGTFPLTQAATAHELVAGGKIALVP